MRIKNTDFRDALACEWVRLYKCFVGTWCLHLQGRNVPLKMERTVLSKMPVLIYTAAHQGKNIILKLMHVTW